MNKLLITAMLAGTVSAASMIYLFNNKSGTNNELAMQGGIITAASLLIAKKLKVI